MKSYVLHPVKWCERWPRQSKSACSVGVLCLLVGEANRNGVKVEPATGFSPVRARCLRGLVPAGRAGWREPLTSWQSGNKTLAATSDGITRQFGLDLSISFRLEAFREYVVIWLGLAMYCNPKVKRAVHCSYGSPPTTAATPPKAGSGCKPRVADAPHTARPVSGMPWCQFSGHS